MKNTLRGDTLYSGDNGRLFCGVHAGATAKATGRDLSGQRIQIVTAQDAQVAREYHGVDFKCETCGMRPTLVVPPTQWIRCSYFDRDRRCVGRQGHDEQGRPHRYADPACIKRGSHAENQRCTGCRS